MSVTEHSSIYGAPRCTESRFVALLDSYGSFDSDALWGPFPRAERPDVARRVYRLFVDAGLDPLVQLGITVEEHTAGTNKNSVLWRGMTHSWGNARTRRDPSVISETYFDPIRQSNYQRYHDVLHSVRDIIYRLKEPTYAYAGKQSIRDVISTFAPEGNPQRYIDVTVQRMNTWIAQGGTPDAPLTMPQRLQQLFPLATRVSLIPEQNSNRSRLASTAEGRKWITVHETGNTRIGANAEMHRQWVHGKDGYGGGGHATYEGVSFTWVVDDREAIMLVPRNERTWQASDGSTGIGNSSESVETCINADGNWAQTRENLARLIARIIVEDTNRSPSRIAQHFDWARDQKNCPTFLRANGGAHWRELNTRVQAILTAVGYFGGDMAKDDPNAELFPTGHWIINATGAPMLAFFRKQGGWERLGYPLEGMRLDPDGVYRQLLENCEIESWPMGWGPHPGPHVRLGGIGQKYKPLKDAVTP
jgi:hypothetical protein